MQSPKIISSVAPYVTIANGLEAVQLAHEDGFSGIEFNEDLIHFLVQVKPNYLNLVRKYSSDKCMTNFVHKTLFRPSIDSENQAERRQAVDYTLRTLDYMEAAGFSRLVLHSFSDLPGFFNIKAERANRVGYFLGCYIVQVYGILAPALKKYREARRDKVERSFMHSLSEIAKYAADKRIDGRPIEIVFEEHYSDAIDYDSIAYGKGNFINVIRGIDTAHQLIRTGKNTDLSVISEPIHFHAVDTNGLIDDHRTIGKGKVEFKESISDLMERKLSNIIVIEDRTRNSALKSKEVLASLIKKRLSVANL